MKQKDAFAQINSLTGIVKLSKIIGIIRQIENFQQDTLDKIEDAIPYENGEQCTKFDDLYVDLTYQRKLKIQLLFNILLEDKKFNKDAAGHIDIAKRPDGRWFVWDGFHRVILAAIVGLDRIPTSQLRHPKNLQDEKCREIEAGLFATRNGKQKAVSPGELFKAELVNNNPTALKIHKTLVRTKLDVEGTNDDDDSWDLGGFALFKKHYEHISGEGKIQHLIDASNIIREIWDGKTKNVSVYFLLGLAKALEVNSIITSSLAISEIKHALNRDVNIKKLNKNQKDFIQPRLHGKGIECVANNIGRKVLLDLYNNNGQEFADFVSELKFTEEEIETLEVMG